MQGFRLPSTILNVARPWHIPSLRDTTLHRHADETSGVTRQVDEELKLPKKSSLVIILLANVLLQLTFFIIVSSSNDYAQHLGGSATFSGLVIGIPTAVSGLTLLPLMRLDGGVYIRPLNFACGCMVLGNVLYALAYKANWLYLILIGRMVCGGGFTFWMYTKRYCSDPRIVGIRRRTTLAGWQVLGQGIGFSLGPFVGGLLYKIGFNNSIFNGFTSPAWIMAAFWAAFWVAAQVFFEDISRAVTPSITLQPISAVSGAGQEDDKKDTGVSTASADETPASVSDSVPTAPRHRMTAAQWGVSATMCWFAMTCFFILGAWESNIPVFTASSAPENPFHFSPFAAGNLIALGGACTMPFLLLNLHFARRVQDRHTLAVGTSVGLMGLAITMAVLAAQKINYGSFFMCWFLVALGFNITSTVTLSLLSKQLPGEWNGRISLFIQWSNYTGRVTGAVWGGSGVKVGMLGYVGFQIGLVCIGGTMFMTLWKNLKAKTG